MDIQKLRQEFENLPDIKGILYGSEFGFNESLNEYYHPDHTNHRLNYAFIMGAWMAWKAQTVPDTYTPIVLALEDVPSKIAKTSFLTMDEENENEVIAVNANELAAYIDELIEAQEPTND